MKRMIGILLAAALSFGVLAMVGCGGDDGPVDTDTTKVVKVWLHKSQAEPEGKVYRALQDLFNEADYKTTDGRDIVMSIEYKNSSDALSTAISGEILSGGLPDVVAVDSPNITSYADGGILIAMDEYLSDEVISDYVDSVTEQSTYNGKLYALSGMDAPGGLYYNKELLKSVGYKDSDFGTVADPWSWKDVEEAMDALKSAGKEYRIKLNLGFGGDEGCMYLYSPLVYSAGGSFIGADNKVSGALTSERSLAGLGMLESLFAQNAEKEWIYNGTNTNALPGGEVAFEIYGPWLIDTIDKSYADFADKYDVMPFPVYEDANGQGHGGFSLRFVGPRRDQGHARRGRGGAGGGIPDGCGSERNVLRFHRHLPHAHVRAGKQRRFQQRRFEVDGGHPHGNGGRAPEDGQIPAVEQRVFGHRGIH